jgi:hypothetical protein
VVQIGFISSELEEGKVVKKEGEEVKDECWDSSRQEWRRSTGATMASCAAEVF